MPVLRRTAVGAAALVLTACSGTDVDPDPADLPAPGFRVYAPTLDGAEPVRSEVTEDVVVTEYDDLPVLVQVATTDADLCRQLEPFRMADDTCRVDGDGVAVTRMEEMSGVGLARGGTLLYWRTLVTEADLELVSRATASLRAAPEASLDDLGELSAGQSTPTPQPTSEPTSAPTDATTPDAAPEPVRPGDLDRTTALRAVRRLAGTIGPREATGRAYARAATWVAGELRGLGYDVARQRFDVPAGESWDVPVPAGQSTNVVATPVGFDPDRPHLVVGAHLDTVPQAPGAEDNASGVGVLLAVAEAVAQRRTRLPVVLVAFGAEEPRGPSDDDHHYGSRHYAAGMGRDERTALRAMVSLDRAGVGATVPVGSAGASDPVQRSLLAAARSAGVPAVAVAEQRSSDHWSFVRAGLPAARLGSTPYAAYHSAADVPAVVQPDQLARVGQVVLAWLAPR
jgi:hypothetical protein